jgi:hypothetical protein
MSDTERYLRELRRALPIGCRRRFVAEVREHFASAIAAEAERGVGAAEAERETIERLGPAHALAEQFLADVRGGALGRARRVSVTLTAPRLAACAAAVTVAIVAGAVFAGRHSSPAPPPTPRRTAHSSPTVVLDPRTGRVRMVVYALQGAIRKRQGARPSIATPVPYYLTPASRRR